MESEAVEQKLLGLLMDEDDDSVFDSDSSSADDDDILLLSDESDDNMVTRRKRTRIKNFIDVVHRYDDQEFKEHFRITRETCTFVIEKIASGNILPTHSSGRDKISPEKGVLITLWYLSNKETFRQIADRFDCTKSAAHKCIQTIVKFLVKISPEFIKWPQPGEETAEISAGFEAKHGIKGIIGAIDGCHINIRKPIKDQHVYCNRKGTHSILLQAVADHNKKFIDVFCGEVGSIHDARMLKRSRLYEQCYRGMLNEEQTFLLGDSAYPNLSWLVVPFKDNGRLTRQQKIFNYRHSSCRIVIENAFGLLKGRFRRLQYFENLLIPFIVECVVASCVLHNICIDYDDLEIEYYDESSQTDETNNCDYYEHFDVTHDRRQEIFNDMFANV